MFIKGRALGNTTSLRHLTLNTWNHKALKFSSGHKPGQWQSQKELSNICCYPDCCASSFSVIFFFHFLFQVGSSSIGLAPVQENLYGVVVCYGESLPAPFSLPSIYAYVYNMLCVSVSNFLSFLWTTQEKGIILFPEVSASEIVVDSVLKFPFRTVLCRRALHNEYDPANQDTLF